jgi:DNA-binding transcriptional regulator LsrR (DeoR family)
MTAPRDKMSRKPAKKAEKRLPKNPAGRPPDLPDSVQMRRIARMYYLEELSRQQISDRLNIDVRKVSWLLRQGRDLGVVRIDILEPPEEELAARLQRKFRHLERVMIVTGPTVTEKSTREDWDEICRRFGIFAANYFEELVANHPRNQKFRIAVTGGDHLLAFANMVPSRSRENVFVHVPALVGRGGLQETAGHIDPTVVASILWSKCGTLPEGHCQYATVSPYDLSRLKPNKPGRQVIKEELVRLENNQAVKQVVEAMEELDVVFAGVGTPTAAPPDLASRLSIASLLKGILTPEDFKGAVGDFAYCPFNSSGVQEEHWRLFMTAGHDKPYWGIEFFKRMVATPGKKVVAFSIGPWKLQATRTALPAKIFNVLIIDEPTARQIVEDS